LKKNISNLETIKITDNINIDTKNIIFKELAKGNTKIFIKDISTKSDAVIVLQNKIIGILHNLYIEKIKSYYIEYKDTFNAISKSIAKIDYIKSGAKTACLYNYCKPTITYNPNKSHVKCDDLRHPIIERLFTETEYVPHSFSLGFTSDNNGQQEPTITDGLDGMLIYGLNSSGKSTIMKALGLSIIMAQAGLYVPATNFNYSPYHSLFARITGNDNIFKGMSSFVLEMTELKAILKRNGPHTLVIGDEVCRGTEHISGNAIVSATIINLAKSGCSFIFATHLHEIAKMGRIKQLTNVKPFHLTVCYDKKNDCLVFDRLLKEGSGDNVYGYTVARYIIDDLPFMKLVQEIKNDLINTHNEICPTKTSKYNNKLYIDYCQVCNLKSNNIGAYDTHHINFQKNCVDGFVKDKPHMQKNIKANLVVLCKECHVKVHQNKIIINGYKHTSNGVILNFIIV
jgi:DNA mismatch repair protein MutS